jgi:penicillin-binding protein 1A
MNRELARRLAIGLGVVLALGLAAGIVLWQRCGLHGCPDVEMLRGYMPDEASVVVDRNGEEIGKLFVTRRVVVPLDSMPEHLPHAFVAIEDQRFWSHGGVDWRRVIGALARNVRAREVEEGSSTITMQLARNIFPDQLPASQRTLWRKLGEARVAREIESRYTKHEILELYVNQIYFGSGAWGIEAAAQEYFGKPAAELNLPESAMLAALPRAPSRLNPRSSEERALEGRTLVLRLMAEQGMITEAERAEAAEASLSLRKGESGESTRAAYFMEAVRRQLENQLGSVIYTGGYRIHTTLDMKVQTVAEQELDQQLRAVESGRYGRYAHRSYASLHGDTAADLSAGTPYLQAAVVVMDARNGDILALIGGRDFKDSEYNRATQARRQPGSAFKPFVFAAALASGYSPAHRVLDQPLRMELSRGQYWEPRNYGGGYSGVISMRDALVRSKNVATVRLANGVGVTRVARMAEQMGLGRMPTNPSMVLGTAEVTPLELAAAYTPFATLGSRAEPRFVTRVVDRHGGTVWAQQPRTQRVLDPAVAFVTTSMLEDVVTRGTATAVRAVGFNGPAAGKTGTTQDAADVWFVGYTPEIVGAVWIGFDRRRTVLAGATGGEVAAPVWGRVMSRAGLNSAGGWSMPGGVEQRSVLADGTVLAEGCPAGGETRNEYFVRGTAPASSCYAAGSLYAWGDTLGYYDSLDYDTLQLRDEDRWWGRLRERVLGREVPQDLQVPPSARLPGDTAARRVATDTARRDTAPRVLGTPVDTVPARQPPAIPPPDTARTRPDTTRVRPDTTRARPDTTRARPDTTAASRHDGGAD